MSTNEKKCELNYEYTIWASTPAKPMINGLPEKKCYCSCVISSCYAWASSAISCCVKQRFTNAAAVGGTMYC